MSGQQQTLELAVLGKVIGTYTGWDALEVAHLQFCNFIPNELGTQFIEASGELALQSSIILDINYETGEVLMQPDIPNFEAGPTRIDWSVFNKPSS